MDRPSFDASRQEASSTSEPPECERWNAFAKPGTMPAANAADAQTTWLARTIEAEIIPRLMLAHRGEPLGFPEAPARAPHPSAAEVDELASLVLARDAGAAVDFVRRLRERGMALEHIYLELLAPVARHLGALWEADLCPFAEVTVGLWRLQQVMHDMGAEFADQAETPLRSRRAMLVPVPGSQHTMGLFMVAEFFRHAGWDVWGDAMVNERDIVRAAHGEWFDIFGVSIGSITQVDALASVILGARKASLNPDLVVIVGGPIISADPSLVARVGADATAMDAPSAVVQAERLVAGRSIRA